MVEFNIGKTHVQGDIGTVFFAPIPKEVRRVTFEEGVDIYVEFTGKVNNFGEHAFRIISIVDKNTQEPIVFDTSIGDEEEEVVEEAVDTEIVEEEEPVVGSSADAIDFNAMTKKELVAYIEENNLDIDTKLTKVKLLDKLVEAGVCEL